MQSLGNKLLLFIILFQFNNLYSNIGTRNFNSSNGLVNNSVRCFYEDDKGELWIGTDGGISIYNGYSLKSITVDDGLIGNYVWSIISDSFGGKWVASYGEGLTYIKNGKFIKYDISDGLSNVNIRTLYYENEILLIGTENGLFQFDYKTKKITKNSTPEGLEYPFQVMQFLKIEKKLFVATRKTGVYEVVMNTTGSSSLIKIGQGKTLFKIIPFLNEFLYCAGNGVFKQRQFLGDYDNKIHNNVIWDYAYSSVSNDLYLASWNVVDAGGALLRADKDTLVSCNHSFGIDSKKIWSCEFLVNNQLVVGSLDKGFYLIDNQLKDETEIPLHNVQGVFEIENNTYYYDERRIYTEKGVPVFSLNQKKLTEWFNVKDLVKTSLSDSLPVLESLLSKNHQINAVKYFKSGIYISTSIGLFKLSNTFKVEKIFRIQIDRFDIIDSTLIYQRPYHEFNIFENFLSKNSSRIKLNLNKSVPSDVLRYQNLGDSVLIWTKAKGVFVYRSGGTPYRLQSVENHGTIKHVDSWGNQIVTVNSKDKVYKGNITRTGVEFNPIKLPFKANSIYKATQNKSHLLIHFDNGIYLSNGKKERVINRSNFLFEKEYYDCFLTSKTIEIATPTSVIQIPIEDIFSYEKSIPKISIHKTSSEVAYNQNNVILNISKSLIHQPEDYEYYYQLNDLDTIPITEDKIYLMNLASGNYQVEVLAFSTFQNKWFTLDSFLFKKLKAPWEKWYFWTLGMTVIAGILVIMYYRRKVAAKNKELKQQNYEKQIIRHRLEAIQAKMNPHFMFNALNSIQNYVIDAEVEKALQYLSEFSKLMRETLEYSSNNLIELTKEVEFIKRYIFIEQMRFSSKIIFEVEIDGDVQKIKIPPMILQPIIENAFIHGLENNTQTAQVIQLNAKEIDGSMVKITVSNPKNNVKKNFESHKSFGLKSIEERLKLINPKNVLKVYNSSTEFTVEIELHKNEKHPKSNV